MGATGLRMSKSRTDSENLKAFGIVGARKMFETAPREAGFSNQGQNDVRISVATDEEKDIVFQFKLIKGGKEMSIRAYDPNIPDKGVAEVHTNKPDLTSVISDPNATANDVRAAQKILTMMNRSKKGIKNSSLVRIANELKRKEGKH